MQASLPRRCLAELVSTFILVLIGCGAMVVDFQTGALTHVGVATVWGLVVMVMIYAVGDVSGAHMNPAVSIAMALLGRMPVLDAIAYVTVQCIAAVLGAMTLHAGLGLDDSLLGATTTKLDLPTAMMIELIITAILMCVVVGVSTGAKEEGVTAGLAVGATIAMEAFVAGPLTKASINPARSLGPALVSGEWEQLWIYIVGPVLGAALGGVLHVALRPNST
ncbi:MAG: aquaporin [Pirellulales bacterium]|nr:aquaporin [Pirellulales bacterium]